MLDGDGDVLVSLVAEADGVIAGHVLFSRMAVEAAGATLSAAGLAPVSVAPGRQGQGIGAVLIRAGLDTLRERDVAISFVLGHPAYYPRFGYMADLAARFASPFAGPHDRKTVVEGKRVSVRVAPGGARIHIKKNRNN